MFCTNCGKEIPDNSKFCTYCGSAVKNNSQEGDVQQVSQVAEKIEEITEQNKTINVVFFRPKKIVGCAVSMKIYVDGVVVAVLKNGEAVEKQIASGKHKVVVEMWSAVSETEVDFNAEYSKMYIDVGIKMGLITNKAEITAIRTEK